MCAAAFEWHARRHQNAVDPLQNSSKFHTNLINGYGTGKKNEDFLKEIPLRNNIILDFCHSYRVGIALGNGG